MRGKAIKVTAVLGAIAVSFACRLGADDVSGPKPPKETVIEGNPVALSLKKAGQPVRARFLSISAPTGEEFSYWTTNAGYNSIWQRDDETKKSWALAVDPMADALTIYRAGPGPNPIQWKPLAVFERGGGLRLFGSIEGGSGHFRGDSSLEASGLNAIISLFQNQNPGTSANETALAFGAYDSAGSIVKTASISSKWVSPEAGAGYAVLRLNSTFNGGATDDVAIRIFGNHGIALWGGDDSATGWPGANVLAVHGRIRVGRFGTSANLLTIDDGVSPADAQLAITAGGQGVLSAFSHGADDIHIGFDADFSSEWKARHRSVARLTKSGDHVTLYGSIGNVVGGTADLNNYLDVDLANGNLSAAGRITEQGRDEPMGTFSSFKPILHAGKGTWRGGIVSTAEYSLVGDQMTVIFFIQNTKVEARTPTLSVDIPGGFKAAFTAMDSIGAISNGKPVSGSKYTVAGETKIYFTPGPINSGTWEAGDTTLGCSFTFAVK